jgi:hypothetical protein
MNYEQKKMNRKESLFRFRKWPVYQSETSLEEVVSCLDLILEDGHITEDEFERYLKEAENLGAQLIAFGKKVRQEGTRL